MNHPRTDMVNMAVQPYLFFGGRTEEALEFYRVALDAKVDMVMRFDEAPEPPPPGALPPGFEKKVMHASFRIRGTTIMASDGDGNSSGFSGFSLSLSVPDSQDAERVFAALCEGGSVIMPLGETFWSPCFGMVADKFDISWMVMVPADQ